MKAGDFLRVLGRIVGVVLIVACFTFQADFHKSDVETRDEWSVGLWFSPWLESVTTSRTEPDPAATQPVAGRATSQTTSTHVTATSWSWVVLAAGVWLLIKCRRRKPAPETPPTATPSAQPPV